MAWRDVCIDELVAADTMGDVMAQFVDAAGQPIDHPINRRAIALPLEALRDVSNGLGGHFLEFCGRPTLLRHRHGGGTSRPGITNPNGCWEAKANTKLRTTVSSFG